MLGASKDFDAEGITGVVFLIIVVLICLLLSTETL